MATIAVCVHFRYGEAHASANILDPNVTRWHFDRRDTIDDLFTAQMTATELVAQIRDGALPLALGGTMEKPRDR